jgi:nucleotide-binding universal stress UspA family protein
MPKRRRSMLAVKTVLHPTDFSERAGAAFELAAAVARDYNARLILLHVAVPPKTEARGMAPDPVRLEDYQRSLDDRLRWLRAGRIPTIPTEALLKVGDPAKEILATAAERGADLIVMGAHGRTAAGRLLMGSVAEDVGRRATCPVLTVRAPFPRKVRAPETRAVEALQTT